MFSKVESLLFVLCLSRVAWKTFLVVQQVASGDYLGAVTGIVDAVRLLWSVRDLLKKLGVKLAKQGKRAMVVLGKCTNRMLGKEDDKG